MQSIYHSNRYLSLDISPLKLPCCGFKLNALHSNLTWTMSMRIRLAVKEFKLHRLSSDLHMLPVLMLAFFMVEPITDIMVHKSTFFLNIMFKKFHLAPVVEIHLKR